MGKIVAIANQKGGCGKTTTTMMLAGALSQAGLSVLVVDADPQGTATRWAASAPDGDLFLATVVSLADAGAKVGREAKRLAASVDLTLIDCPPAVESPSTQSAIANADAVIIPVVPSPPDLWAAIGIRQLVVALGKDDVSRLVVNMAPTGTTLAKEAEDLLADFGIPRLETTLHMRNAYRQASVYGSDVLRMKPRDAKAASEVESLVVEVRGILGL